jgi:hypothetical protein
MHTSGNFHLGGLLVQSSGLRLIIQAYPLSSITEQHTSTPRRYHYILTSNTMELRPKLPKGTTIESFNAPKSKYKTVASIGHGGFSHVYEVKDPRIPESSP